MIDINKTHYNSIFLALATAVGLLVLFIATGFVFTSDNPVSKSALLVGGCLFCVGAVGPRRMLMLMVPITFFLDGFKRLLILTGRTQLDDVTSILAIAPLATLGILIGFVIRRIFFRRKGEKAERLAVVGAAAAFIAFGGMEVFTTGNPLHSLKTAANTTVYYLLPWVALQCFRTREQIERFFRYSVLVGIPVAIYGIWQYMMGLSQFEIEYLKSGLSSVGEANLEDVRPRPFSTLSSPTAYSYVMLFMLALSAHFVPSKDQVRRTWKANVVILIYALALLVSMVRSAIVAGIGMMVFARLFRSKAGVCIAYSVSAVCLAGLIAFAEPILHSLDALQTFLPTNSDWQEQAFRLGTFSDRLIGYRNVLSNPSAWPLVANPLAFDSTKTGSEVYSHDLISQMLLRIGAIPVFLCLCGAIYFVWRAHHVILRLPERKDGIRPLAARLMALIVAFFLSQAAGSGMTTFPLNFWMGMFAGLLSVICIYLKGTELAVAKTVDVAAVPPAGIGRRQNPI